MLKKIPRYNDMQGHTRSGKILRAPRNEQDKSVLCIYTGTKRVTVCPEVLSSVRWNLRTRREDDRRPLPRSKDFASCFADSTLSPTIL